MWCMAPLPGYHNGSLSVEGVTRIDESLSHERKSWEELAVIEVELFCSYLCQQSRALWPFFPKIWHWSRFMWLELFVVEFLVLFMKEDLEFLLLNLNLPPLFLLDEDLLKFLEVLFEVEATFACTICCSWRRCLSNLSSWANRRASISWILWGTIFEVTDMTKLSVG